MSFYDGTAPLFTHALIALSKVLAKGEAYAKEQGIAPEVLLNARLYPNMFSLTRQIQLACDFSGKACARLAGTEVPSTPDTETTFEQLQQRIAKTIEGIKSIPAAKYEGGDTRDITFGTGGNTTQTLPGQKFVNHVALPNFFFHCTTAYNILRHNGVVLGKLDFLGAN
ncbi:MAG: DUF1993 domain-containing protein [Afipia felis]|jgi:hypothetical protein|uniref:Uncharacterized protein conserved in bacteria n=2 Tax=Afipia felis TaxID=1035 RepID=A0A380WB08_AFIFE|nr:DUF1993 domain-containing protein [Afipia felis]EKS29056.1 hypothetical protein HMPREF9697_01584 [Afipia felis ATCC 53690]MBN9604353.1 DUF1993 domain-containing protein [Afipia felis]SUU77764.1 Uncharacterized protein conserved in bacteria [Afipia felis]SUU85829.1 Uncharacterized protein conserved in bacteria [Afipia felis]